MHRAPIKRLTHVRRVTSACGYRRKPRSIIHRPKKYDMFYFKYNLNK